MDENAFDEIPETSTSASPPTSLSIIWTVVSVGLIMATLLTLFTPTGLFSNRSLEAMFQAFQANPGAAYPTPTPRPMPRVGIVAGHAGNDSGAVCPDGLTEAQVNLEIALRVQQRLLAAGYQVDLLNEFDERLAGYQAQVLVSIHNDSCNYINDEATGFKVAAASSSLFPEKAERLTACLVDRYAKATGLRYHPNTITRDMTEYHTFSEINSETTAAIIETGFLNLDRRILTEEPDRVAQGVADGILCFLRNEPTGQNGNSP